MHILHKQYDCYCTCDNQSFKSYLVIKALGPDDPRELAVVSLHYLSKEHLFSIPLILFFWAQEMKKPILTLKAEQQDL